MKDISETILDLNNKLHTLENHRGLNAEVRAFINEQLLTPEFADLVENIKPKQPETIWVFERSSGYSGYRCTNCNRWVHAGQIKPCECDKY